MKTLQFTALGEPLQIAEMDKPSASPGGLVFKVLACGICGSDLHSIEIPGLLQAGNVLGHEYSGEVVEIGPGVSGWSIGDRLTAVPRPPLRHVPGVQRRPIRAVQPDHSTRLRPAHAWCLRRVQYVHGRSRR